MTIDQKFVQYSSNPADAEKTGFSLPHGFDYSRYYDLKVNYVGDSVSAKSGSPYYKVIWEFVDKEKYGKGLIFENYFMHVNFRNAQFENIFKNWGCAHKGQDVTGKVVRAQLDKEVYEGKDKLVIKDIKEWHLSKEKKANPEDFDSAMTDFTSSFNGVEI